MAQSILYHDGNRRLQDEFDSRRIADRLEEVTTRTAFTPSDIAFIEKAILFFLATADAEGRPDVSHKGGPPGFVRVTGPSELAFPDYDGNGMFKSLGNIAVNPQCRAPVHRLRAAAPPQGERHGDASSRDDPLIATTVGAQLIVRVTARAIFPNCPRYIPTMRLVEPSIYTPRPGEAPVEPAWKSAPEFADAVHPRQKVRGRAG